MTPQLTGDDYGRMICATVECCVCGARRGESCRNPSSRKRWAISTMHADRRTEFAYWRKRNRPRYLALRLQLLRQAAARTAVPGGDVTYVTPPG